MVLAKFKEYRGEVIFINPSQVRFIKKDASGYATIVFDNMTSVVVNETPESAAKALCNAVSV